MLLCALPPGAQAQQTAPSIMVTAGEHRGFTRIVLQSTRAFTWSVRQEDQQVQVRIGPPTAQLDLRRAFDRITRQRLAGIEQTPDGLLLTLGCDCPIRSFEERAGVVVFDIMAPESARTDPDLQARGPATVPDGAAMSDAAPGAPAPARPGAALDPDALTRRAGQALAETLRHGDRTIGVAGAESAPLTVPSSGMRLLPLAQPPGTAPQGTGDPATDPAPVAVVGTEADTDTDRMGSAVALRLAEAVAQGLLAGIDDAPQGARLMPGAALDPAAQQARQLRILNPLQPGVAQVDAPPVPDACAQTGALAFLAQPEIAPFAETQGQLMQTLHGEFDRPDEGALLNLIHLYLQHGFGAEARQLIDTARAPVAGHDLLRGLADLLEGRQSNSRMLLSSLADCDGPAGLVAALAGAPQSSISAAADAIALSYGTLPDPLKRIVAQDLVALMVDAGALDQARVVLHQMQAAGPSGVSPPALPEALLNHARGAHEQAVRALEHRTGADDAAALSLRLRLLRDTGAAAEPALIEQAQTLAGMLRQSDDGIALLRDVIHLQAAAGAFEPGFASLERLRGWLGQTPHDRQIDLTLTDRLWQQVADDADDQTLLALFLTRDDGRRTDLSAATRTALAARLLRLGLAQAAIGLVSPPTEPAQTLILAEALIATGRAERALALLAPLLAPPDDLSGTDVAAPQNRMAQTLLARALRDRGATDSAIAAFVAVGASHEAAQLAMATGDWRQLETLLAQPPAAQQPSPAEPARPVPGSPAAGAAGAVPRTETASTPNATGTTPAETGTIDSQAELLALTRLLLAAPGDAEGARPAPPPASPAGPPPLVDTALAAPLAAAHDSPAPVEAAADPPTPPARPERDLPAGAAPALALPALDPPMSGSSASDAFAAERLAAGTLAPDTIDTGTSPAAEGPDSPEAALMRRNATLLGQSAALRTLIEDLLAEGQ
ncbi:MAG: hypothetical protein ACXIVG_06845 [Pararhodobacter sp.]